MHAYLPAIGFGQIKKKSQLQQLLSSVQNFPDQVLKKFVWMRRAVLSSIQRKLHQTSVL